MQLKVIVFPFQTNPVSPQRAHKVHKESDVIAAHVPGEYKVTLRIPARYIMTLPWQPLGEISVSPRSISVDKQVCTTENESSSSIATRCPQFYKILAVPR